MNIQILGINMRFNFLIILTKHTNENVYLSLLMRHQIFKKSIYFLFFLSVNIKLN